MSPHRSNALLMVVLLLSVGLSPAADAWHATPGSEDRPDESPVRTGDGDSGVSPSDSGGVPRVAVNPVVPVTDSPPVDRELERIPEALDTTNETLASTYRLVGDTLNMVADDVDWHAQLPITLLRDGGGGRNAADPLDLLDGGFSEVQMDLGTHPWDHDRSAAFRGEQGYTTPLKDDGTYPQQARALLVTPELDLRTNALQDARTDADGMVSAPAVGPIRTDQSAMLQRLYWTCDLAAIATLQIGMNIAPLCLAYRDLLEQQEKHITLEYRMRYNLGLGYDGVAVMVFTVEPSVEAAQACASRSPGIMWPTMNAPDNAALIAYTTATMQNSTGNYPESPCRVVLPAGGYNSQSAVQTLPGRMGYTGFSNWMEDVVDLTPWVDRQSVWVGFYFASTAFPHPPAYFQGESRFPNPDAGFFGFHVDDLAVKSLAAPVNLVVRPLVEPSFPTVNGIPTLHPDEPTPVRAHVANLGSTALEVAVEIRVLHAGNRSVAAQAVFDDLKRLPPGAHIPLPHEFGAELLGGGEYIMQVCAYRAGFDPQGNRDDFCQDRPAPDGCSIDALDSAQDRLNADPCAQWTETRFDLRPLQAIIPGPIQMGQQRIEVGDTTTVRVPIRNGGNQEETLQVQAYHVDLSDPGAGLSQDMLLDNPVERGPKTITLAPGEEETLEWSLVGGGSEQRVGQYRFVALVNSTGSVQPVFNPDYDLLPTVMQPWRSPVLDGDGLTIDGRLDETGWLRLPDRPLAVANTLAQVANNGTHLFLGLKDVAGNDGIAVFLNDGADDDITSGDGGTGVNVTQVGATGLRYDPASGAWVEGGELAVVGTRAPFQDGMNWTYELRIPINTTSGAVGMLLRFCNTTAHDLTCAHFPQGAPLHDGEGFHAADQNLANELQQWHTIRLGDPDRILPGSAAPYAEAVAGPGFGVGTNPSPYLLQDFSTCPSFQGWVQQNPRSEVTNATVNMMDKWNCHNYPDSGRTLLYKGIGPDSDCGGGGCLPYAGIPGSNRTKFTEGSVTSPPRIIDGFVPDEALLWTPPIEIPVGAAAPTLVLAHQYSTHIEIQDDLVHSSFCTEWQCRIEARIRVNHALNVSLEKWAQDEGRWVDLGVLEPHGGYTTEEHVGIRDTLYHQRKFFVEGDGRLPLVNPRYRECPEPNLSSQSRLNCAYNDSFPAWWWPQGDQPTYRPPDSLFPKGGHFPGGSPWTTDLIPLYGVHFEGEPSEKPLNLGGETVRLRFSLYTSEYADRTPDVDEDWGWRIGGLAVMEGDTFWNDLTVESATLFVGYDPSDRGLGPGTTVPVNVTVRNDGLFDANGVKVTVVGRDLRAGEAFDAAEELCTSSRTIGETILAGEGHNVTLACTLPPADGDHVPLVAFVASVEMDGEDFLGNNQQRVRGQFPMAAAPDAAVFVDALPRDAAAGTERTIQIWVQNLGNVPLEDINVTLEVLNISDPSSPPDPVELDALNKKTKLWWRVDSMPIQVDPIMLVDLNSSANPIFTPDDPGTYVVQARVEVPGLDPSDLSKPADHVRVQASEDFYRNDFSDPPTMDEHVMGQEEEEDSDDLPTDGVWSVRESDGVGGSAHLRAGDDRGEIQPNTDAIWQLPDLDLATLRGATLSFQHRYDLEEGFDAGRVEMSLDGGERWQRLIPRPQHGLPDGYPSIDLVGANAILGDAVDCFACAYTGSSEDLPGADDDGWLTAEFDLGRQPQFYWDAPIDVFPLDGLSANAEPAPWEVGSEFRFSDETWKLDEANAEGNQRYWWILNATYSEPRPLTGDHMWWSGSAGAPGTNPINTMLDFSLDPGDFGGDDLILTFWDWRAGWQSSGDDRSGTAATYRVTSGGQEVTPTIVDRRPDGWAKRIVDLTPFVNDGPAEVRFTFISGTDGAPFTCTVSSSPCPSGKTRYLSTDADNRGWFIDSIQLTQRGGAGGESILGGNDAEDDSLMTVIKAAGNIGWSRVRAGDTARDGGWHIFTDGTGPVWQFSEADGGNPGGTDSHLITPLVDLRSYSGDSASLRFDHRYRFRGALDDNGGNLGRAYGGGVVAYQTLDESTRTFGPWKQLGAVDEAPEIGLKWAGAGANLQLPSDELYSQQASREAMGYPSIAGPFTPSPAPINSNNGFFFYGTYSLGQTFPISPGLIRTVQLVESPQKSQPFAPFPIAHVFSGDSADLHPDTGGWDSVDWDVSHLIGRQVHFAFHAWTPPTSCSGQDCGWSVANVTVDGQQFRGEPVKLRVHLATDGSMPKGEWSIDDILIVGQQYQKGIVVRSANPDILDVPGAKVTLAGEVRNVGFEDRSGLVLAIEAINPDTGNDVLFKLLEPDLVSVGSESTLPPGIESAWGPFNLARGERLPIRLGLTLPDGEVDIRVQVLECSPAPTGCKPVRNEQGAGLAAATWSAIGELRTDIQLTQPVADRTALVVADPPVSGRLPGGFEAVTLHASLQNNGTTTPIVQARWTVTEVLQKGSPSQLSTLERLGESWTLPSVNLKPERGETLPLNATFPPPREGIYRATLVLADAGGSILDKTTFEFLAGEVKPYYLIDFAQTPAAQGGWNATVPQPSGSPAQVDFRQDGGRFIWGVSSNQFNDGLDYCSYNGCNPPNPQPGGPIQTIYGLHGMAQGPTIDLSRVVGNDAVLSVRHGYGFTPGDGAVVEALPHKWDEPSEAFQCEVPGDTTNRNPAWFRLVPADQEDMRGQTGFYAGYEFFAVSQSGPPPRYYVPQRENPLGTNDPIIGQAGPAEGVDDEVLRFSLDATPQPICPVGMTFAENINAEGPPIPQIPPSSLINYTMQLRLRTGTTPGINDQANCQRPGNTRRCLDNPRTGSLGWHIDALAITSVDIEIGPGGRNLPMLDGYPKRFNMLVTNQGPLAETLHVGLDPQEGGADASWFNFPVPEVTLAPGEATIVPFEVDVPTDPAEERGGHAARLRVTSSLDPSIYSEALVILRLDDNPLPDLAITQLEVQAQEAGDPIEPGKPAIIFTTIANEGQQGYRDAVPVRVEAVRLDDEGNEASRTVVGTTSFAALQPGETATVVTEWVPPTAGAYRIKVVVDPAGRLLEKTLVNNRASALVDVVPLQRPDVRVTDLRLEGVAPDGYALDGSLVTIVANVTNVGTTPAIAPRVTILAGNADLVDVVLDSIAPGQHREVSALRIVSPGESTVRALVTPSDDDARFYDKNEVRRILRVRGIDLVLEAEATMASPVTLAPGDTATTRIDINNTGNAVERVVLSLDPTHAGWGIAATPNPVPVAPGSTAWSLLTLRAPAGAVAGSYNLTVLAAPQSQPEFRHSVQVPVQVAQRVEAPLATLENATTAPGPAKLPVLLQSRTNIPQNVTLVLAEPDWPAAPHAVALDPSQNTTVDFPVTVPAHTPPGQLAARIVVQDAEGTVLAEARGVLNITAQEAGSAQWSGRPAVLPGNLTARVFQVMLNISNDGNIPFEAEAVLGRLSEGVEATPGPPVTVAPGAWVDLPVLVRVSPEFTGRVEGRTEVLLRTNHTGTPTVQRIAVLDLPNLGALPDLAITDVSITPRGTVATKQPVQITITVENLGFTESPATELRGYVNGEAVGSYSIASLPEGGESKVNLTWTFPASGDYIVHLVADGAGNLTELHDDNNGWTQDITVETGDLVQWARETPAAPLWPLLLLCLAVALARRRWP